MWKGSVGVAAGLNGSIRVEPDIWAVSLCLPLRVAAGQHGSVRVNEDFDAGHYGSKRVEAGQNGTRAGNKTGSGFLRFSLHP